MSSQPGRPPESELDRLSRDFADLAVDAVPAASCPGAERFWLLVGGELSPAEARVAALHAAGCPVCAEEWRLVRTLRQRLAAEAPEESPPTATPDRRRSRSARRWAPIAAAAGLTLALGVLWFGWREDPVPPGFRAVEEATVRSLIPSDEPLPRDAFLLRWTPAAEGSRYSLSLATTEATVVARRRGLTVIEHRVPPEALATLPDGATLIWQIEVLEPDGRRYKSPVFTARLE